MLTRTTHQIGASPPDRRAALRLRGEGVFTGDVALTDPLHLAFARSDVAYGRITSVDLADARDVAGVVGVHIGDDVRDLGALSVNEILPLAGPTRFPVLAQGFVDCLGQPIGAVLAQTPQSALDGAEALEAVIDDTPRAASGPVAAKRWRTGDPDAVFQSAAHVVEVSVLHPRLAPSPLEPRAIAVEWAQEGITVWHSTQTPHRTRSELVRILGIDAQIIRVIAPDVGGAFGMKASLYPEEVFAVWAALHHRRSVRWTATRSEDFLSATHGRGLSNQGRLAVAHDGTFLALEAQISAPVGPWLPNSALIPAWNAARILPGPYDIATVDISTQAVPDGKGPTGIYRGAGRPEAACLMERLVDSAAHACRMDPAQIRAKNLYSPSAMPARTATGNLLDSGDYPQALDLVCDAANYTGLIAARDRARTAGRISGVGLAFYLEPSGEGFETARVSLDTKGRVTVASGSSSQGQGRETGYAQIAAEVLDIPFDLIDVIHGDSATCPAGIGAVASRGTAIGGSAVFTACERLRARMLRGDTAPIVEDVRYENEGQAWGYGVYVAAVDVCRETGAFSITHATCFDDVGRVLNPAFVEGQIRGGFAQGLGEALLEQVVYDDDGQLLTGSFMDYAMPRATDMPEVVIAGSQHPSPLNALGVKGVGEAGTIGAPAVLLSAVLDALQPMGVVQMDMPLTPCKIWTAMRAAHEGKP